MEHTDAPVLGSSGNLRTGSWLDRRMGNDAVSAPRPAAPDLDTADGFTRWVEPHWHAMATLAARYSTSAADDILQDALLVAWRKRAQFDPERGSARNWLLAITADQRRKAWRRALRLPSPRSPLPESAGPSAPVCDETALDLRKGISRLPAPQRLAVDLHYYLGLGVSDVAAVMGCPEGTVKSHLSRGRARLHQLLGEDYR